jgi:hypothetical protein
VLPRWRSAVHNSDLSETRQHEAAKPHKVYNVGQCFLFLAAVTAALFTFTWSFMIAHYITRFKSDKLQTVSGIEKDSTDLAFENSEYKMFLWGGTAAVLLSWVRLLIALVRGWYWYG